MTELAPPDRDIAMVFQNYALYPHMSVRQNLGFGLSVRHDAEIRDRRAGCRRSPTLLGLEDLLDRKPANLSGGQRQRVAMGRAIIREPKAFLMDEPLSNLDAKLRVGMRASLAQLHARLAVTSVYVTHDQTEAMTLGHRVAVMRDGQIVQVDVPQRLYHAPRDLFVAAFIGSPAMNLVEATVEGDEIAFGQFRLPLDPRRRPARDTREVILGIRPEAFNDAAHAEAEPASHRRHRRRDRGARVGHARVLPRLCPESDDRQRNTAADESTLLAEEDSLFTARVDPATTARSGAPLKLAVDPASFHFFDVRTGESLLPGGVGRSVTCRCRR